MTSRRRAGALLVATGEGLSLRDGWTGVLIRKVWRVRRGCHPLGTAHRGRRERREHRNAAEAMLAPTVHRAARRGRARPSRPGRISSPSVTLSVPYCDRTNLSGALHHGPFPRFLVAA